MTSLSVKIQKLEPPTFRLHNQQVHDSSAVLSNHKHYQSH